jgi:hypothetical protein
MITSILIEFDPYRSSVDLFLYIKDDMGGRDGNFMVGG